MDAGDLSDGGGSASRSRSSRRSSIDEVLGIKRKESQSHKVNFNLPTVVESPIKDLPTEVRSTQNRRGTMTTLDLGLPSIGAESTNELTRRFADALAEKYGVGAMDKPPSRRVCEKSGTPRVKHKKVSNKRLNYIMDIYTTMVELSWPWTLMMFAASFYVTWLFYAILYYVICLVHGDFEPENLEKMANGEFTPCVLEMENFVSSFLFSLETQHTIGYGSRQTTPECDIAVFVMSTQSIIGCLIQTFMVGLVFAKLSNPSHRSKTIMFSKRAVICQRNKKLCLIFRCGDMRPNSFIVGAQIAAKLVSRKTTKEGEMYYEATTLQIKPDSANEANLFLLWPFTVTHVINKKSPLYRLSEEQLKREHFELHVSLEGTIETTSMNFQARSSYLPGEILWGHRFEPMITFDDASSKYQVNFHNLNSTYEVDTPTCSAADLERHYRTAKATRLAHRRALDGYAKRPPSNDVVSVENHDGGGAGEVNPAATDDDGNFVATNARGGASDSESSSSSSSSGSDSDSDSEKE